MKLLTAATMRELDRATIEDIGIPGIVLMEAAGKGCADHVVETLRQTGRRFALVLCGPGNNGGDGFVVARHVVDRGFGATVAVFTDPANYSGDALLNYMALEHFPVDRIQFGEEMHPSLLRLVADRGVVVDALFGTGLVRPVDGRYARAVDSMAPLSCPKVAVDIPSGVCSDTGRILGIAFRADLTVTFGAAKLGHYVYPGRAYCGKVDVVPIGIPAASITAAPGAILIEKRHAASAFAPRDRAAFKNRFGHLAVIGGLAGKAGAALLASMGAVRTGAGLVTVLTDRTAQTHCEGRFPELMIEGPFTVGTRTPRANELFESLDEMKTTGEGVQTPPPPRREPSQSGRVEAAPSLSISFDSQSLKPMLAEKSAFAIGPGLSTASGVDSILDLALACGKPGVLDADALNLLALRPARPLGPGRVLTPHPGEAARLLGCGPGDVQANRVQALLDMVSKFNAVIVLKGAGTLIAAPDGRLAVNDTGGPALATAGTGDVLTGMIGGLLARGLSPWEAACTAVHLHGLAGDLAAERLTEHAVGASDVLDSIPEAIKAVMAS